MGTGDGVEAVGTPTAVNHVAVVTADLEGSRSEGDRHDPSHDEPRAADPSRRPHA